MVDAIERLRHTTHWIRTGHSARSLYSPGAYVGASAPAGSLAGLYSRYAHRMVVRMLEPCYGVRPAIVALIRSILANPLLKTETPG